MSVARNASWLALGQFTMASAAIFLPLILARRLSIEDYGVYKQIDLVAGLIAPFLILGFDKSITYYAPRKETRNVEEITAPFVTIISAAVIGVVFALVKPATMARLFGCDPLPLLVATAALYAVASALSLVGARTLISVDRAKSAALIPAVIGIPRTIVLLSLAVAIPRLDVILKAILAFAVVHIVTWLGVLVQGRHFRIGDFHPAVLSRHVRYGGILALAALFQTWAAKIDAYLVSSTLPAATFAIFAVGKTRVPFLPILARALGDAVAPRYSKLESEGKYVEMAALWRQSVEALFPFGLLTSLFLAFTAKWSIPLVFGDKFTASVPIFEVFAFSLLIQSLVSMEQMLRALSALRFLLTTIVVSLVLRTIVGISVLRAGGDDLLPLMVLAQLLVGLMTFLVRLVYVRRRLGVPWSTMSPAAAFRVAVPTAIIGSAGSFLLQRMLSLHDILMLGISCVWWGGLIAFALWRQGLWARVLPASIARRLSRS